MTITEVQKGKLLAEGKTKRVWGVAGDPALAILESKDDITAGDGAKHDIIPEKGKLATQTTCNVFSLLKASHVPVAFIRRISPTSFLAPACHMISLEVVARREAHGSYCQRNPHIPKGTLFPKLVVELYLKTKDRQWQDLHRMFDLDCDDPLMKVQPDCVGMDVELYNPHKVLQGQQPFLKVPFSDVFPFSNVDEIAARIHEITIRTFLVLEKAWQLVGRRLVDFKIEFGVLTESWEKHLGPGNVGSLPASTLLVADVIDNDSWRVLQDGEYIDKQAYRNGEALSEVAAKFAMVAELTNRFVIPSQRIILLAGSAKDDLKPFGNAFEEILGAEPRHNGHIDWCSFARSGHKQPVQLFLEVQKTLQDWPDSVVIAYAGRSNALGPILAANCTVPVITVPACPNEFFDDVMTVLEPENAVLAALQILAMRNPYLYSVLRARQEERFVNVMEI